MRQTKNKLGNGLVILFLMIRGKSHSCQRYADQSGFDGAAQNLYRNS